MAYFTRHLLNDNDFPAFSRMIARAKDVCIEEIEDVDRLPDELLDVVLLLKFNTASDMKRQIEDGSYNPDKSFYLTYEEWEQAITKKLDKTKSQIKLLMEEIDHRGIESVFAELS